MGESILVIEDNQALGETIVSYLSEKKFTATHFLNGEDALLYLEINSPDLIICDIMLPGISGIQVAKRLKSRPKTTMIPIIFLSAVSYTTTNREAFNIGVEDFITKPFNFNELHDSITTRLAKAKSIKLKIKNLEREKEKFEKKVAKLNNIINHQIRNSAAKILESKDLIDLEVQHEDLKKILINETSQILKVTQGFSEVNQIPQKIKTPKFGENYTFFVVDDDVFYLRVIERFLELTFKKVNIKLYSKPGEALHKLETFNPNVIILDINMPIINGFEFLEEMQKKELSHIPVIVHSSSSNPYEIKRITNFDNVKGFVGKPLKPELMKISLTNLLGDDL